MASHLRRFVTSPLSIFEFEFASTAHTPSSLLAAAKCLSLCIDVGGPSLVISLPMLKPDTSQLAPGDDLIMSYMYSLLNYIAATSKDIFETSSVMVMNLADVTDLSTLHSVETGLRGLSEDEKRTVGISTISVASRLALENKNDEACHEFHTGRLHSNTFTGYSSDYLNVAPTDAVCGADRRGCDRVQSRRLGSHCASELFR